MNWLRLGFILALLLGGLGLGLYLALRPREDDDDDRLPCTNILTWETCTEADDLGDLITIFCGDHGQYREDCNDACVAWFGMAYDDDDDDDMCATFRAGEAGSVEKTCATATVSCGDTCDVNFLHLCSPQQLLDLVTDTTICPGQVTTCLQACDELLANQILDRCDRTETGYNYCTTIGAGTYCTMSTADEYEDAIDTCQDYACTQLCRAYGETRDLENVATDECLLLPCKNKSASCCVDWTTCETEALYWHITEDC